MRCVRLGSSNSMNGTKYSMNGNDLRGCRLVPMKKTRPGESGSWLQALLKWQVTAPSLRRKVSFLLGLHRLRSEG